VLHNTPERASHPPVLCARNLDAFVAKRHQQRVRDEGGGGPKL
jgi:hypothetical protein